MAVFATGFLVGWTTLVVVVGALAGVFFAGAVTGGFFAVDVTGVFFVPMGWATIVSYQYDVFATISVDQGRFCLVRCLIEQCIQQK
jgi:hypothetical protein